jgi:hypothetical protein
VCGVCGGGGGHGGCDTADSVTYHAKTTVDCSPDSSTVLTIWFYVAEYRNSTYDVDYTELMKHCVTSERRQTILIISEMILFISQVINANCWLVKTNFVVSIFDKSLHIVRCSDFAKQCRKEMGFYKCCGAA